MRQLNCLDGLWEHLDRKNTLVNQKAFNHHKSYLGGSFPAAGPAVAAIDHVTSEEGYCVRHVGSWSLCCQEADDALCQRRAYQIQDGGFEGTGREERSDRIINSFGRRFHPEPLTVMEPAGFWSTGGQGRACSRKATGTPLTSGFEPTTLVFACSLPQRVWSRDAWLSWNARFVWPFRFQNNKLLISRLNPPTPPYAFIVCSTS